MCIHSAAMHFSPARIVRCFIPSLLFIKFQTIYLNCLIPCLPGHPETDSEESNGGPLVINPLPAGSSLSFGAIIGIPLMSLPGELKPMTETEKKGGMAIVGRGVLGTSSLCCLFVFIAVSFLIKFPTPFPSLFRLSRNPIPPCAVLVPFWCWAGRGRAASRGTW